ncbi:MAG: hypothetical protein NTZ27_05255 [Ignavibacteriales bacterium]|nr:hypothetical protein [Ignavibacteriales bacterium]
MNSKVDKETSHFDFRLVEVGPNEDLQRLVMDVGEFLFGNKLLSFLRNRVAKEPKSTDLSLALCILDFYSEYFIHKNDRTTFKKVYQSFAHLKEEYYRLDAVYYLLTMGMLAFNTKDDEPIVFDFSHVRNLLGYAQHLKKKKK